MPDTLIETSSTEQQQPTTEEKQDTFAQWRGRRGASADAATPLQKGAELTETAETAAKETSESAPESAPANTEQKSKFELRKQKIQSEIDELVKQRESTRREVEELRKSKGETGAPKQPAAAPAATNGVDPNDPQPAKPAFEEYSDFVKYEADLEAWREKNAAWIARREWRLANQRREQAEQQKAAATEYNERLAAFEKRGSEYAQEEPEYPELLERFKQKNISDHMAMVILIADNGPRILHHLMKNPDEMARIEKLEPLPRLEEMYKLRYVTLGKAAKAETEEETAAPVLTKSAAPAAGTRLSGRGGSVGSNKPSNYAAFKKKRFG